MQSLLREREAVVLVVSAGGISAPTVRSSLPNDFPIPIIIVQHRRSGRPSELPKVLPRSTKLDVKEAREGNEAVAT